jgi:hypothetical protein
MVEVQEGVTLASFRTALAVTDEPKSILAEVVPFLLVVIGIPAVLLLLTPRKRGESAILRRPQSWRHR